MKKKKALVAVLVLVGAAILAAAILGSRAPVERQADATPPPLVRVLPVAFQDARLIVRGQGNVAPAVDSVLVAQVAGRVEAVGRSFAEGSSFRRGETLLQIDARDYELAVAQAEAAVAQARVRLDRELAEAELARSEWRDLGLGEASPLATRQPQLAEAEASLAAAEANLEMARLSLERTSVRAPFDGRLRRKLSDLGQYVRPGAALAEIYSTAYAEVPLPVAQRDFAFLDVGWEDGTNQGPQVRFRSSIAGEEHIWGGRIVRAGNEIDSRTRMLTVYARIDDRLSVGAETRLPLPVGAFLDAEIQGRMAAGVVVVPRAVLREGDRLLVVDEESRLRFREVEVLRLQDEDALIRAGLEEGELVCLSAIAAPVDGMAVRTVPEVPESPSERQTETRL
jgi:RND family efflux transporter MFP subunit